MIFNFDGRNAAELSGYYDGDNTSGVKGRMQNSPSYYEDKVENTSYDWEFVSSSYDGTVYKKPNSSSTYKFSSDRNVLTITWYSGESKCQRIHKKVDKSFFKIGRSRTPSGTMHE